MAITKREESGSFLDRFEKYIDSSLNISHRVNVAKRKYLMDNQDDIMKAVYLGYGLVSISEFSTKELLKTGVPKNYSYMSKDNKSIEKETKISVSEIEQLCNGSLD